MGNKLELNIEEMQKERNEGKTLSEIAKKYQVSPSTVSRRLKSTVRMPVDGELIDFGEDLPMVIYKDSRQLPFLTEAALRLGGGLKIPEPECYKDFAETYQNVVWVYSSVFSIANSLTRIPLKLYKRSSEQDIESNENAEGNKTPIDRQEVKDHPVLELLNRPNDDDSWEDLLEKTVVSLELGGDAYIEIVEGSVGKLSLPAELYYMNPMHIKIKANENKRGIAGYVFSTTNSQGVEKKEDFRPDEVIHIKYHNPLDYWYGQGSALAASRSILLEQYLQTFTNRFFENDATPRGVLMTEQNVSEEQAKRILSKWRQKYGGVKNAHKVAVLPLGLKYEKIGSNLNDLNIEVLAKDAREQIMAAFGVNDAVLGLSQNMPRDVYRTCMRIFYENTLMPKARKIANALTFKLLPKFNDAHKKYYFEFDFSAVTAEPYDVKMNRMVKLFDVGAVTPNEIAAELTGKTHNVEGADSIYIPSKYVPINMTGNNGKEENIDEKRLNISINDILDKLNELDEKVNNILDKG